MPGPARQDETAGPEWRRPLIAAAITVVVAVVILVLGYERMRDQADDEAGALHAAHSHAVTRTANGSATRSGSRRQVPAAPSAAQRFP
jgi:Sec-independent protein translocase protein TatA